MPEYILFVDDEKLIKRLVSHYFRNQIRKGEYEFIFAYNGIEAKSANFMKIPNLLLFPHTKI
jgi:CheY-like chemotaxis protein